MPFTLATWNINSIRLREGLVARLMAEEAPDVLCIQECKSPVELIPVEQFRSLGYGHMVARGQKGYNGVAILSKLPLEDMGDRDFARMGHARHVAARLPNGVVIHNCYVPAGGDVPDRAVNEKHRQYLHGPINPCHTSVVIAQGADGAGHMGTVPGAVTKSIRWFDAP
jgi:exodeoxyribonuclease-3